MSCHPNILNNMKGRALSLENHADLRSTDPAMTIAWAFSPYTVHLAAERSAGWRSGELNGSPRTPSDATINSPPQSSPHFRRVRAAIYS
jgi:hypothetical protein